jgi:hypothetical protein
MSKIEGKYLEFWYDGKEVPVVSAGLSEAFDQLDSTDSATELDGKDFEVGRAARSFSIESNLYKPLGAIINSGNLVIGSRYQVVLAGATLTGAGYEAGQIFTAVSALTMDADDTVYLLPDKNTGKTLEFSFNSVNVPLVSADININFDQLDVTDTSTTGDGSETLISRADRESKITSIMRSESADLLTTNPVAQVGVLTFNTGQTITGSIIPVSKEITDEVSGYAKVDYTFKWKGAPTELECGLVCGGVEKAFKLILKRGASTNKQYTGNCIITQKTISSEIKGLTKISYTIAINGAVTYAVAN